MRIGDVAMAAFILAVIIAGLFGPYLISIILIGLCLAVWGLAREDDVDAHGRH